MSDKQKRHLMRKAKQLAAAEVSRKAGKNPDTREVIIKAIAGRDAILFQARSGYFSPRTGPTYTLSDLDIVSAMEQPAHLVEVCAKLGFVVLAQAMRYKKPAAGTQALTELADIAAKWLKVDVEALKAELAKEREDEERAVAEAAAKGEGPEAGQ